MVAKENITILDFELIETVARALSVSSTEVTSLSFINKKT